MTHIEQMIKDMCPNGVEFKTLGEVAMRNKGMNITAAQMKKIENNNGNIRIFAAGNTKVDALESDIPASSIIREPSIIVKSRGNIGFEYYDKPFTHKNEMWSYSNFKGADIKFVYYYLQNLVQLFQQKARANSVKLPQLCVADTDSFAIPIPPIEIQKKIVECLDKFSALAAELQAELQKRRTQYEYYRTRLLTPPPTESNSADKTDERKWEWKTLGEIGTFTRGRRFVRTDIVEEGQPCIHYGDMYTYYGLSTNHARTYLPKDFPVKLRYAEKGDVIIVGAGENDMDIGVGCVWEGDEPVAVHDACYIFKHNQNPRYISHFLRTIDYHLQIKKNVSTAKICAISPEGIAKAKIALPSLEEQARIVSILDRFEKLLTSMEEGIPAEQAAQQKRYEYYRDKLLTFEKRP